MRTVAWSVASAVGRTMMSHLVQRVIMIDDTLKAVAKLRSAIDVRGPSPKHHEQIMTNQRIEWPTLWKAIDDLLACDPWMGKATWIWNDTLDMSIPCCSVCRSGPLTGKQIEAGRCEDHA